MCIETPKFEGVDDLSFFATASILVDSEVQNKGTTFLNAITP